MSSSITARARFCQARCGAGKTTAALAIMGTRPARYVYAVDRREVAEGRADTIRREAIAAGLSAPVAEIVFSDRENNAASKPIAKLIEEAIVRCDPLDHSIIIITHAGMQMTTHQTYKANRWNLIVDETPDIYELLSLDTGPLLTPFLANLFELQEDGAISLIRPIAAKEFDRIALRPFRQMFDIVRRGGAKASISRWEDTDEPWHISRCWDATILDLFDSVTFFADSFTETIPYHVLRDEGVEFKEIFLQDHRVWRDRRVTISHYVNDHEASAGKFKDAAVRAEIVKIADHMSSSKINNHLWTTNAAIAPVFDPQRIGGECVSPRQAGANQWREWHDATMIYAARPSPEEILVHGQRGMTEADLISARGGYDIKQFVMRLSLRDPDSTAPVSVRVYDREQAVALKSYLDETYGFDCDVQHIDLGITVEKKKRGAKAKRTKEEVRASRSIQNRRAYEKRIAVCLARDI